MRESSTGPKWCALFAVGMALTVSAVTPVVGQEMQPGFYYHDPSTISVTNGRSGPICTDASGKKTICAPTRNVVITGQETCEWSGRSDPCTTFGYEFNYSGAVSGTEIECKRTRTNRMGRRDEDSYTRTLDGASGRVSFLTFRTYAPVEEQIIFSEVHDCSYGGELVSTVEFIIYYEPGTGGPGGTGPGQGTTSGYFPEVPNACSGPYLTEATAAGLLRATAVRKHVSSHHLPELQSQCIYSGSGGQQGQAGYVFKFMLSDMFDVTRVSEQQILFNATFANGGDPVEEVLGLGARAFRFEAGDRSTLFVITGIKGLRDPTGREREFTATYYIDHPEMDEASRSGAILEQARLHLRHWAAQQ